MARDPHSRPETWLEDQVNEVLLSTDPVNDLRVGFHIMGNTRYMVKFAHYLKERVPLQVNTGPLLNLIDIMDIGQELADMHKSSSVELFFHTPFAINLYAPVEKTKHIANYIARHVALINSYGIEPTYIVHSSYPTAYLDQDYLMNFKKNLVGIFKHHKCKVLIENLVGSDKHEQDFGGVQFIADTILKNATTGQFRMCLDFEHMFGHGEDWTTLDDHAKSLVGLIHLNGWPPNVTYGSRIDLHSHTTLKESVNPDNLRAFLTEFKDIPMVFERRLGSVMAQDYEYCKETLWAPNEPQSSIS